MTLREWIIELSVMLDEELSESSSDEEALTWFGNLPPEVLERLNSLARSNPPIRDFLNVGEVLLKEVKNEI